jgi:PAS domain S-box-containing protein
VTAALVAAHGLVVLFGWWADWRLFVRPPEDFIPMAPSTALAFVMLGLALIGLQAGHPAGRRGGSVSAWAVAVVSLVDLGFPAWLDRVLGGATGQFGSVQLGVMSPITAGAALVLALGIGLLGPRARAAGICATLAAVVGVIVALGYAYGTPLLYGSSIIPVALPTGLSFLLLGSATVAAAGPGVWPLKPLVGASPRARMLRAFLPATAGLAVVLGLVDARFGEAGAANRVLVAGWLTIVGVALVTVLVSGLARHIGADLEDAYTARHRAEQQYREFFEQTLAGVATTTVDGRIVLCNDAFARMLGFASPAELQRQSAASLYWESQDRERVLGGLRDAGALHNVELRMRRQDGTPVWVLANLTLHVGDGEPRIENTVIDISSRKTLEQQLWQAQKLEALGSLAGGVAHDFNNLLTVMLGCAEMLRMELPKEGPHRSDLDEIENACRRATALTRQLLAFSRRQPFEPRALALDQTVRDMDGMLRRLLGPEVRLVTATDDRLAPVWADRSQIEQVALNLAVNARDAMPQGGTLTIETRNVRMDQTSTVGGVDMPAGSYVLLAVSDTGTGMDAKTLGRIFEPFFTTKEKGKGTGLGLATVYGVVKQSRGHIQVASEPGVGTTFNCYFPATDANVAQVATASATKQLDGRETILVVEDEAVIMTLVVGALQRQGYHVLSAPDGDAAIRVAASHEGLIHLVLSDGVLSGMSVPELLGRLRAERPETRILLMSGYAQEDVFHNEVVEAATAFLPKPFTIQQLTTKVREVLDGSLRTER